MYSMHQAPNEQFIQDFLEQLVVDSGLELASESVKTQVMQDLRVRLDDRFFAAILSSLEDAEMTQFRMLLEQQAAAEVVQHFLQENLNDPAGLFAQVAQAFRKDYLATNSGEVYG